MFKENTKRQVYFPQNISTDVVRLLTTFNTILGGIKIDLKLTILWNWDQNKI